MKEVDTNAIREASQIFGEKAAYFIGLTLKNADEFVAEIKEALERDNAEDAGLGAHSLKSIMLQAGAKETGALAEIIQDAGEEGDLETCKNTFPELQAVYEKTKAFMLTMTK